MILPEEFSGAWDGAIGCFVGLIVATCAFVAFLTVAVGAEGAAVRTWSVPTVASGIASIACLVGLIRCRRVVRAWRDQKRAEAIMAEMKRDGES
jgi:hypothetical protein